MTVLVGFWNFTIGLLKTACAVALACGVAVVAAGLFVYFEGDRHDRAAMHERLELTLYDAGVSSDRELADWIMRQSPGTNVRTDFEELTTRARRDPKWFGQLVADFSPELRTSLINSFALSANRH